jgi:polymorphic membrane protein
MCAVQRIRNFYVLIAVLSGTSALAGGPAISALAGQSATQRLPVQPAAAGSGALPESGNPGGHFYVPPAGQAASVSHPNHVIGNGTPASCTSAAVVQAVAAGGIITFSCGSKPVTILMRKTASVPNTSSGIVLDGGGLVTLSGGGARPILFSDTCAGTWSTQNCVNQPYPRIVVQNLTFEDGYSGARQATCTANNPKCWYGGVNGGAAIYVEGGQFKAVNSQFVDNQCYGYGPDLGGGAIRVLAQYDNRPVYITSDTFTGNRCSNGGALSSIGVQWDVLNSVFTGNKATGWGANPPSRGTPGGGSGGAIYNDGSNYSTLIAGTVMSGNTATEGGGAIFYVLDSGRGNLTIDDSHLANNSSGQFQTSPGIFDYIDGHGGPPVMINSTDS